MTKSHLSISGEVTFTIVKPNGSSISVTYKNLIVQWGLNAMANSLFGGDFVTRVEYFALGTNDGATSPTLGDTELNSEARRDLATVTIVPGELNKVEFLVQHATGAVVGTFREAGLFDADTAGNMFNRLVFEDDLVVGTLDTLKTVWNITFKNVESP
jgi:hypothetical protein